MLTSELLCSCHICYIILCTKNGFSEDATGLFDQDSYFTYKTGKLRAESRESRFLLVDFELLLLVIADTYRLYQEDSSDVETVGLQTDRR